MPLRTVAKAADATQGRVNMSKRAGLLVAAIAATLVMPCTAEVVATCGASEGWSYYIPGPLVPEKESGWFKDGISKGSFQLIRSGDDFDIIFTDAFDRTISARADGADVVGFPNAKGDYIVSVMYGVTFETYIFWLSQKAPTVSYSQAKFGADLQKHSLLVAPCRKGNSP